MFRQIISIFFLPVLLAQINAFETKFRNGEIYKIKSFYDNKTLTALEVSLDKAKDYSGNVTVDLWTNHSSQKWLAIQAVFASDNFILLPLGQQLWNYKKLLDRGTKYLHAEDLPDFSIVLTRDQTQTDQQDFVSQQLRDGKRNQQWRLVDLGQGKVLIKSLDILRNSNGQQPCLKNSGGHAGETTTSSSLFKSAKTGILGFFGKSSTNGDKSAEKQKESLPMVVPCDAGDPKQQWEIATTSA